MYSSILLIVFGSKIFVNLRHSWNKWPPISVTEDGIMISSSEGHLKKQYSPMNLIDEGIVIFVRFLHSLKLDCSSDVKFCGRFTSVILHPLNVFSLICISGCFSKKSTISTLFFNAARCRAETLLKNKL